MLQTTDIDQLHQQASAATGLDDFGGNDDGYLAGLEALINAVEAEVDFKPGGQQMFQQMLVGNLSGRLLAQRGFKAYPDSLEEPIRAPIIVTGFTRSGTTALHRLLASVPRTQALEYWLGKSPMPRPPRDTWAEHPAFRQTAEGLAQLYDLAPQLRAIHLMQAEEADEDRLILEQSFKNFAFMGYVWAPSYADWLKTSDRSEAYARMRRVLQLIGYRDPSTWVLKDPMHLPCIDLLLRQFSDACIVHTCREPVDVMPSVCSLMYSVAEPFQNIDKKRFGPRIFEEYAQQMDRFMALREQLDPERFLDVQYRDITADPAAVARRVYAHFDIDIGPAGERELANWQQENTQHKYGRHEYTLEEYGLRAEAINERLANYRCTYFNV